MILEILIVGLLVIVGVAGFSLVENFHEVKMFKLRGLGEENKQEFDRLEKRLVSQELRIASLERNADFKKL